MNRNDPNINRKFNYLYLITNVVNKKIYIGVHRTDNLYDGYMGSGKLIRRSIKKFGKENFKIDIISFFETYIEALDAERRLVTDKFIERNDVYNLREGGFGNCKWSSKAIKILSEKAKERYSNIEFLDKMNTACWKNHDRNKKISDRQRKWIENNPEDHKQKMDKINKNPEKIKKTADAHRGTIRSELAKNNIKRGIIDRVVEDPIKAGEIRGRGMIYIYNPILNLSKRVDKDLPIPDGWIRGSGPKRNKSKYKNQNIGSYFAYDPNVNKRKRFQKDDVLPDGWVKGLPPR